MIREHFASVLRNQKEAFLKQDRGVRREILHSLGEILNSGQIIIITGLRRAGKSTLMTQIADRYLKNDYYFVNFEDERLLNFKAEDFDSLHETLISLFGEKKTFLLDEIQNVKEWERFTRRLHDQGYKFIITGSNASLLSQELGTRLTGRNVKIELYPFSFFEFLEFKEFEIPNLRVLTTRERGHIRKFFDDYIVSGGIPDALKYPQIPIHKTLYDDVLYRDIATRYKLENTTGMKELAFFLISNISSVISFNKLKDLLKMGSVNTVKSYIEFLENSWLFFVLNKYAFSVKEQQIAAKKIYSIDTGLASSVGFGFSENKGKLLENTVFLHLKRYAEEDIYYYKTKRGKEADFYLPKKKMLIQVTQSLLNEETRKREVQSLLEAMEEVNIHSAFILTNNEKNKIKIDNKDIIVLPVYEWLLKSTFTENGFTREFEDMVLEAEKEPVEKARKWKSEKDVDELLEN